MPDEQWEPTDAGGPGMKVEKVVLYDQDAEGDPDGPLVEIDLDEEGNVIAKKVTFNISTEMNEGHSQ